MHLDTATTDAPIARMQCPGVIMLAYLEDEVVASFPAEYRPRALKAFKGLPDSDRDMEVMQIMSLRDHFNSLITRLDNVTSSDERSRVVLDFKRVHRDLYWRTRIIALSDQVRGVGA